MDRIILINKPYRWTSFDVVKKLRKPLLEEKRTTFPVEERLKIKKYKVGHAGTLDPLATGLLILCTGKLTSSINLIQDAEKEYLGTMILGSVTDSYDLEMPPHTFLPYEHINDDLIYSTAKTFLGTHQQVPPIHSAKKIDGKRAYEKARRGDDFELKSHTVTIKSFEITSIKLPAIFFTLVCSKGTYVRSLVHDFGQKLLAGAHLSALCRTRIGDYRLADALTPDVFLNQLVERQGVQ